MMKLKGKSPNFQVFVRSPDARIPLIALNFQNPNPDYTVSDLKSSLFSSIPPSSSFFFTLNGKKLSDSTHLFEESSPFCTLTVHVRCCGGGGDGGATGAESRDCYLNMYAVKKPDKVDPNEVRLSKWLNCSLSNEPLRRPIVIDKLGNLFNKEALVEGLLKKNMPREFGYIKGLKDMIPVELSEIPSSEKTGSVKFQCPITGLEFSGNYKFYAIKTCGHVMSAKGFKEVKSSSCLVCLKEFVDSDKIIINGSDEEVKELWEKLMEEKAAKAVDSGKKSKKLKNNNVNGLIGQKQHRGIEGDGNENGGQSKKFKATELAPANATKEVYASIFTSSKKSNMKETFTCRSLPLGRN